MNVVSEAGMLQLFSGFAWGLAGVFWLLVVFGKREPAMQARWNGIAAIFAAIASGLLAASLIT